MSSRWYRSSIAAVAACLAGALLVPANAAASTSLVQFQDGDQPRYVAFDETSGLAYVALYHSVAVVDSATRAVVGTVSPGTGAIDDLDVDRNTGAAYIASGHAVTKIDASAVVGDMPTPAALATLGFRVTRLVVAPELDRVFVAGYTSGRNGSSGHLTSLIASTGAVDQYLHLGSTAWLQDLEVDPTRGRLYGTTSAGVAVYDVTTLGHVDTVATTSRPQQLALDRSRNRLYVTQSDYDAPTAVIDTVTNTLVPALSLPGEKESMAVAVDPERGRVFVVRLWGMAPEDSLRGTVDAYTEGASERVTVRVGTQPVGLGVRPSTGQVWVADNIDDTVTVLTVPPPAPVEPTPPLPEPDRQGPTITISSPLPGAVFSYGQVANVSYRCSDPSRVQECRGSLIGDGGTTNVPVADGGTLDTTRPGGYLLRVLARDGGGFPSVEEVEFTVQPAPPGDVIRTVTGGETVSTGDTASPQAPLQTSITVPAGLTGTVSVDAQPLPSTSPSGFTLFGQQLELEGPMTTADKPYTVSFTVDESVLGGLAPADVQVFRNGAVLSGCTHRTAAVPDPCIVSRGYTADQSGDALVTVRTSHFSDWTLGRLTYSLTGPLAPIAAAPIVNTVKAGASIPVKFKLGGNRGLDVLTTGSPTSTVTTCSPTAKTAEEKQTSNATTSALTYDSASDTYTYTWRTTTTMKGCRDLLLTFKDGSKLRTLYKLF